MTKIKEDITQALQFIDKDIISKAEATSQHSMVYGLSIGLVYSCGVEGAWKDKITKLLNTFNNPVLITTADMSYTAAKVIADAVGPNRLYLDSGGFTLWKKEQLLGDNNPEFCKLCNKMQKKYLRMIQEITPMEVFELDNEYYRKDEDLLSPLNYCRQETFDILGFMPTPVFKMHQGFQYWKDLCESSLYPKLAIGGFAATREWHTRIDEIKILMDYARQHGKKVHLLGCQNTAAYKSIQPDTVDYNIFQLGIVLNKVKKEHPGMTDSRELRMQAVLWAFANAKSRSFLYDCYKIENNQLS